MTNDVSLNTDQLEVGLIVKNYKELCSLLNEKVKGGNNKKAQLKEWERYFKYDKKGHSFIITYIYNVPLPANHNKTMYISEIEKLIIDKLVQFGNNGKLFISKTSLMKELQMINENYAYAKYKQLRLAKHMNITLEEVEDFYMTSSDLLKRNIESALNSLRNQSLLFWSNAMTLCFIETAAETNMNDEIKAKKEESINEYGEEEVSFTTYSPLVQRTYRKATEEEIELVLQVEREVLDMYNCNSINDIFKRNKSKQFYKEVRNILFDAANIYFYFNSYEIIINEKHILSKWEDLAELQLDTEDKNTSKHNLNSQLMERINSNANRRNNMATIKKDNNKIDNAKRIAMRTDEEYLNNTYKLTNTLINKNAKPLKYSLENDKDKIIIVYYQRQMGNKTQDQTLVSHEKPIRS